VCRACSGTPTSREGRRDSINGWIKEKSHQTLAYGAETAGSRCPDEEEKKRRRRRRRGCLEPGVGRGIGASASTVRYSRVADVGVGGIEQGGLRRRTLDPGRRRAATERWCGINRN
jgi:hypothetical protein